MNRPRYQYLICFLLICSSLIFLVSNSFAGAWLPTKMESDTDADGTIDSIFYTLYQADGLPIESRNDNDADGVIDSIVYNKYNSDGYTMISKQDLNADGVIDSVLYFLEDKGEHAGISESDNDADGTINSHTYYSSNTKGQLMTQKYYEGTGKYNGNGNQTSTSYHTYDDNCNIIKTEKDNDLDNQIDEVTHTTYDAEGHVVTSKTDNDNDGKFESVSQFSWDSNGLPLRSEIDTEMEASGIAVKSKNIYDFMNTYDANGNAVKIETNLYSSTTTLGMTHETQSSHLFYNTYEYFEGAVTDGTNNNGCDGQNFNDDQTDGHDLALTAIINTAEAGNISAVWQKGGEDTTSRGDRVVWGYFYADPNDVSWGSINNPEVFVKIWYDAGGRVDVNFFHVSVPDIDVSASYNGVDLKATATISKRYIRHYYNDNNSDGTSENIEDGFPASGYSQANNPTSNTTINNLNIGAMINTVEAAGSIDGVWILGGTDITSRGDQVVWGYFYADPNDVSWGSMNNPELFVKIWFDAGGRIDVNYFHVSVPDIEVYSDYGSDGVYDTKGTTIMNDRYIRHEYYEK